MATQIILTVMGSDRPGLTRELSEAVLSVGGNWLKSHLSLLGGTYVGSVLVDLEDDAVARLEEAITQLDATGLRIAIVPAEAPAGSPGETMHFELVGQDRLGIVREVTTVLANLGVNIEGFATAIEMEAWSGQPLFRAEADLTLPDGCSQADVQDALEAISGEIMVDFTIGG